MLTETKCLTSNCGLGHDKKNVCFIVSWLANVSPTLHTKSVGFLIICDA